MNENQQSPKQGDSVDARLRRLEDGKAKTDQDVQRVLSLVEGNPGLRVIGLFDKLEKYIEEERASKKEIQALIRSHDKRLEDLEEDRAERKIVIHPSTAVLGVIIGVMFIAIIFLSSSYLQNAGKNSGSITPILPFIFGSMPHILQGNAWKYLTTY